MKRKKLSKWICMALCACMVFGSGVTGFSIDEKNMPTGKKESVLEKNIGTWIAKGYVTKYKNGEFKPEEAVKKHEAAAVINRVFEYKEKSSSNYKDVKKGDLYYSDMAIAKKYGYFLIGKDGKVNPKGIYTREDFAFALYKIMKFEKPKKMVEISKLKDRKKITGDALVGVELALEKGILTAAAGTFSPKKPITKAEALAAMDKCLEITKVTYGKAGTYTPRIVAGSVTINVPDVEIVNSSIKGDLIIGEGVGEGNIKLKNVNVMGNTIVRGGGMNSIVIEDCKLNHIIIQKVGNMVRVVAVGETTASSVSMESGGKLEEDKVTGTGFNEVVLSEEIDTGAPVSLVGDFGIVEVQGEGIGINLSGGTVSSLTLGETAQNTALNLGNNAVVSNMEISASVSVAGTGKVAAATVTGSNVALDFKGNTQVASLGISADAKGTTVELGTGTTVSALNVDSSATVSGTGKIGTAVVSTDTAKITAPTAEVKHTVTGNTTGGTNSGTTGSTTGGTTGGTTGATGGTTGTTSGGGGGGGGSSDKGNATIAISGSLAISGESKVGSVLTAEGLLPVNALVTYQWKRADSETGTYTDISGANQKTYCPVTADTNKYLKVTATGKTGFSGTLTSKEIGPILRRSIKEYKVLTLTQTGDVANKNLQYATSAAVMEALPKVVSVTLEDGISLANIPLIWNDTEHYNGGTPGEYLFTAGWGTLPPGVDNDDSIAPPTLKLKVEAGMIQLCRKASGTGMPTSELKLKINGAFVENYELYFDGVQLTTSKSGVAIVGTELLKDLSRVEILHDGVKKKATEAIGSW